MAGKQMVDYIADYLENIRERPVLPSVEPFYIRQVVPTDPPEKPEKWSDVFGDIEKVVMNGVSGLLVVFSFKCSVLSSHKFFFPFR